jgi:glycosyltransferase involved in cell wall biosynthesis
MKATRKPRVLHVIGQLHSGGAERQLYHLASGLGAGDWDVHVLSYDFGGRWAAPLRKNGIQVVEIPAGRRFQLSRVTQTRAEIRRIRPDILHTWMWEGNSYGRLAALGLSVPVVIAAERNTILKGGYKKLVDRLLAAKTDHHVCNSLTVKRWMEGYLNLPSEKCTAIFNGVEPVERLSTAHLTSLRAELGLLDNHILILCCGRLVPEKRHIDVVHAIVELRQRGFPVQALLAGEGPCREMLQAAIRESGAEDAVKLIGVRKDLQKLFQLNAILCHVSTVEGQSNVILEAMAEGLPIVTSAIPNNMELIQDEKNGLVVPVGNPMEIANAVTRYLENPNFAERCGKASRNRIREEFRLETMIQAYSNLYYKLMGHTKV